MKRSRPYLTAKKSLFPVFWSMKTLLFVVFAALAVVIALMGDSIAAIASFASTLHYAFAALTIVMFLIIIGFVIHVRSIYIKFYDGYVVKHKGVLFKHIEKCMLPKIISCNVYQSFWGRLFRFGDVKIDAIGKWDIDLLGYKAPNRIRKRLDANFISAQEVRSMRQTIVTK